MNNWLLLVFCFPASGFKVTPTAVVIISHNTIINHILSYYQKGWVDTYLGACGGGRPALLAVSPFKYVYRCRLGEPKTELRSSWIVRALQVSYGWPARNPRGHYLCHGLCRRAAWRHRRGYGAPQGLSDSLLAVWSSFGIHLPFCHAYQSCGSPSDVRANCNGFHW